MRLALFATLSLVACAQDAPPAEKKMHKHTNRLAKEKSPYLLQHAHNPVDWYPWGDEAFARAKKEQKPILLSIGYSTCHWCHVMERESFENEDVAKLMNEHFVCIKVDREERPDVDQVYMDFVQRTSGHGGWPLTAVLTPDREPFFGGTYFPRDRFVHLLKTLHAGWTEKRDEIVKDAKRIVQALAEEHARAGEKGELKDETLARAVAMFENEYDAEWGGFGSRPKFPRSVALEFLMRRHARGAAKALPMVEHTLVRMAEGGMYDQLGGGFARYSTDEEWLVPHFEKMLYDNALLVRSYVQAWQITKKPFYERIARETIAYVMRDMLAPEGAFYSAEDADSEKIEGRFYVWNPKQVIEVLGEKDGAAFCKAFDVREGGNWHPHEEGIPHGNSVLRVLQPGADFSDAKRRLLEARSKRVRPGRDEKILTEWNALMISALSVAGAAFDDASYVAAAEKAAGFVLAKLRRADGRLLRRYKDGEAAILAVLDDYAFLADALVDLYQATFKVEHLETATALAADMIRLFGDDKGGGFWFTAGDGEALVTRMKEIYDGALPSGTSVALHALVKLADLASREDFRKAADAAFAANATTVARLPSAYPHSLSAFDMTRGGFREIVIAGDAPELLRVVRRSYLPNSVVVRVPADGADDRLRKAAPLVEGRKAVGGRAAAYVCENQACKLPVTTAEELEKALK